MLLDTDTSFYFDPITVSHINTCRTYTFIGNGNWDDAANWALGIIPPAVLPAGSTIIINPITNGECVLSRNQEIATGAYFNLIAGKKLLLPGNLNIRQ